MKKERKFLVKVCGGGDRCDEGEYVYGKRGIEHAIKVRAHVNRLWGSRLFLVIKELHD
ncbi:hypothetical protein [uncultured Mediterranean phage uvMED]|nr:hypothetical protein [uncultured Mediterranean phage uvMED]